MSELTSSVRNLKKQTEPRLKLLSGNLGITLGGQQVVDVPNRSGWVYVRLLNNTSELIQAYNGVVSPIYNLPVRIKYANDRYEIYGRDTFRYQNWGTTPSLIPHGITHTFNKLDKNSSSDVVWVHQEQFYPLAPMPSGTSGGLIVAPYIYNWFGDWKYAGNLITPDVVSNQPTGSATSKLMLLCLEGDTGDYHFIEGNEAPYSSTGIVDLLPYLPSYDPMIDIPIAFIRISAGTSVIGWNEIYDVRQFYGREIAGGTGSSGGGIEEAPINGTPYSRQDAGWISAITGSSSGAPYNSSNFTGTAWVDLTDGENTTLHTHTGLVTGSYVGEAPINGNQYGRENGTWTEIMGGTGSSGSGGDFLICQVFS